MKVAAPVNVPVNTQREPAIFLPWQLENEFFAIFFDLDSGRFNIWRKKGKAALLDGVSAAFVGTTRRAASEKEYARSVKTSKFCDNQGAGEKLVAQCIDRRHELDFETRIYIFENRDAFAIETICKNVSRESVVLHRIEPASEETTCLKEIILGAGQSMSSGRVIFDFAPVPVAGLQVCA